MRAGLLAFGSSDRPRLLPAFGLAAESREWHHLRPIVPDYSGGTAMDLHHLPFESAPREADPHRERFTCQSSRLIETDCTRLQSELDYGQSGVARGRSLRELPSDLQLFRRQGACSVKKVRDAPSPVGAPRQAFRRQPAIAVETRPLITLPRSAATVVERSRRLTPIRHRLGVLWGISLCTSHSKAISVNDASHRFSINT